MRQVTDCRQAGRRRPAALSIVRQLACLLLGAGLAVAQDNLLPNGDFEAGTMAPEGWGFVVWSTKPSRAVLEWSESAASGKRAVALVGQDNAGAEAVRSLVFSPPVDVPEGLLKLTGAYKVSEAASAQIQVRLYRQPCAPGDFAAEVADTLSLGLGRETQWTPFSFDLNIGPGIRQVMLLLRASDLGTVCFDDLALRPVTAPLSLRLYPAEYGRGGAWPLVQGAPSFVRLMLLGDRARFRTAVVRLDLPPGVGEFGLLGAAAAVEHEGKPFKRYQIPLAEELLASLSKAISHCGLTLWLDPQQVAADAVARVQLVVDGNELEPRQVPLRLLPPLPRGPRPKQYLGFFCWGLFGDVPKPLWPSVYELVRGMGVTHHLASPDPGGWTEYLLQRLRAEGRELWANVPPGQETMAYGKGVETRIIAAGKAAFAPYNEGYRRLGSQVTGVFWDWEPPNALGNPLWDDAPTVAAFAARENLDPATLNEARLRGELRERFLAFRTWQLGEVLRLWAASVRDVRPDLAVAICQGSGMPPDRMLDYKAYADIPNLIHLPMIYTSSPLDFARNVAGMRAYLPQARLWPMTSTSMLADGAWPAAKSPRSLYFDCVTPALLGAVGWSHWPDLVRGMDMEYVWELTRAQCDLGAAERFLAAGPRTPPALAVTLLPESEAKVQTAKGVVTLSAPQWERFALSFAYEQGGERLAVVCNLHPDKPATARVSASDLEVGSWQAYDPVTRLRLVPPAGETWTAGELAAGIHLEVPALSMGMLVLSRQAPAAGFAGSIPESAVRDRLAQRRAAAQAGGGAAAVQAGRLTVDWQDVDGDGNAEVHVASADQDLGFGPSGNLWSWRRHGQEQEMVNRFDGAGFAQDRFWWPTEARSGDDAKADYELVTREIKAGRALVTFRRPLSHWTLGGLVLEKTYAIPEQGTRLQVSITVRNESPTVHEFSYWAHGALRLGGVPTLSLPSAAGVQVVAGPDQPREVWAALPGLAAEQAPLLGEPGAATLAAPTFTLGAPGGPRLVVTAEPTLLQVYRWWDGSDQARYTLEWMYQKQRLSTGQSWTTRYELRLE